jgi:hypothetical protein
MRRKRSLLAGYTGAFPLSDKPVATRPPLGSIRPLRGESAERNENQKGGGRMGVGMDKIL